LSSSPLAAGAIATIYEDRFRYRIVACFAGRISRKFFGERREACAKVGRNEPCPCRPFGFATRFGTVSFLNTLTVFGTPSDVTLAELALEMLFAADDETVEIVKRMERERIAVAASVSDRRPVADDVRA
jgi:hypothetical protein